MLRVNFEFSTKITLVRMLFRLLDFSSMTPVIDLEERRCTALLLDVILFLSLFLEDMIDNIEVSLNWPLN